MFYSLLLWEIYHENSNITYDMYLTRIRGLPLDGALCSKKGRNSNEVNFRFRQTQIHIVLFRILEYWTAGIRSAHAVLI